MRFFVCSKRSLLAGAFLSFFAVFLLCMIIPKTAVSAAPRVGKTVVLDAGHGGIDVGVVGIKTHARESDINLAITKKLEKLLYDFGYNVVLTRQDADGLYGTTAKHFKMRDMKKRAEIINAAQPDLVLSIHCNYFASSTQRGAQVFYAPSSQNGKQAAGVMQGFLNSLPDNNRKILSGDYFVLECSKFLSLIIECGFLSSALDEALLINDEYQAQLAYVIACGAVAILEG